jgi:hypothetical protein
MITTEDLLNLLQSLPQSKSPTAQQKVMPGQTTAYVITNAGVKRRWQKGDHLLIGTMQGNVGSPKRSRKGRTYHAPNGSRFYQHGELDNLSPSNPKNPDGIFAYKA